MQPEPRGIGVPGCLGGSVREGGGVVRVPPEAGVAALRRGDLPEAVVGVGAAVAQAEQGRGYGKAAFAAVLDYIRTKPFGKSDRILLTCNRENPAALGLYQSFGFCPTGNEDEDEIELGYTLASKKKQKTRHPLQRMPCFCLHQSRLVFKTNSIVVSLSSGMYSFMKR